MRFDVGRGVNHGISRGVPNISVLSFIHQLKVMSSQAAFSNGEISNVSFEKQMFKNERKRNTHKIQYF